MEWLRKALGQVFSAYKDMTGAQRASTITLVLTIVIALGLVAVLGGRPKFVVVASGMDQREMAEVIKCLDEYGEQYRTDSDRGAVLVSQDRRAIVQDRLVRADAVRSDKMFGHAEFIAQTGIYQSNRQRDDLQRIALQNELRRMIQGLDGVERARVEIQKEQDFEFGVGREQTVGAAVTVATRRSVKLDQAMANTIIDLVASAVRNADPGRISVVDANNWSRRFARDDPESVIVKSGTRWDLTKAVNDYYCRRIEAFIAKAGFDAAVVVDCKLNLHAVKTKTYSVDGNDAVTISLEKTKSSSPGAGDPYGPVGTEQQRPNEGALAGVGTGIAVARQTENRTEHQLWRQDYGRILREVVDSPGQIDEIHVGVILFDDESADIEESQFRQELPKLLAKAAGIAEDASRTRIAVVPMKRLKKPAYQAEAEVALAWPDRLKDYAPLARVGGIFLLAAVALFFLYGLGKRAATVRTCQAEPEIADSTPPPEEPLDLAAAETDDAKLRELQKRLKTFAEQDGRKVAGLLRRWLVREG